MRYVVKSKVEDIIKFETNLRQIDMMYIKLYGCMSTKQIIFIK